MKKSVYVSYQFQNNSYSPIAVGSMSIPDYKANLKTSNDIMELSEFVRKQIDSKPKVLIIIYFHIFYEMEE